MQAVRSQSCGDGLVQSLFGLGLLFGSEISLGKVEILGGCRGPAHGLLEILEGVLDVPRLEVDDASRVEQFGDRPCPADGEIDQVEGRRRSAFSPLSAISQARLLSATILSPPP